jgi:putative glutamine amidotransferase
MQLMSLQSGGSLNQHLPDTLPTAAAHRGTHEVLPFSDPSDARPNSPLPFMVPRGQVFSNHHQAVADPGTLLVIAKSPDGVIEALTDPRRRFCVGVQWHPERTTDPALGPALFAALVQATRR